MGQATPDTAFLHQMVIAVVGRGGDTPSAQGGPEQDHNWEKKRQILNKLLREAHK